MEHLARPVSRAYCIILSPGNAPEVFVNALKASATPPRGPVIVEVPKDVWRETVRVPEGYWKGLRGLSMPV